MPLFPPLPVIRERAGVRALREFPRDIWLQNTKGSGVFEKTPDPFEFSAPPRCLDGGDVDLSHRHHRREGALCLAAPRRQRVG